MPDYDFVSAQEWVYFHRATLAEALRAAADHLDRHCDGGGEDNHLFVQHSVHSANGKAVVGISVDFRLGRLRT